MGKKGINKSIKERCLLTEVAPFETPMLYSNWGSYNYLRCLKPKKPIPPFITLIFTKGNVTIPYKFRYKKDVVDFRSLYLLHPKHSKEIVDFYSNFDVMIIKACQKSNFSLRAPFSVAKSFNIRKSTSEDSRYVEELDEIKPYASSYFTYKRFSHLHKFFESPLFTNLEKDFSNLLYTDITKFFPSTYTHTITWALRGKRFAKALINKDECLGARFDLLMRNANYGETSGIVIGPEMSRIFSELILQSIDFEVENRMLSKGHKISKDYSCCRYIDDYFIFYNQEQVRNDLVNILKEELEKFKLYLSKAKSTEAKRPFITDVSTLKIELSQYISELSQRLAEDGEIQVYRELNKIRAMVKANSGVFHSSSRFFLSALGRRLRSYRTEDEDRCAQVILSILDLAFHWFRMDIRVPSCYRITAIVLDAMHKAKNFRPHNKSTIYDKIYSEILAALKIGLSTGCTIEISNLLIAASELGNRYLLPKAIMRDAVDVCRKEYFDENSSSNRLSYFEIVSFLYYFKAHKRYDKLKSIVIAAAESIIKNNNPVFYSECAHLLFDIVSCPYLNKTDKNRIIQIAMAHENAPSVITTMDISRIRNFIDKETWYFNWNIKDDLRSILRKKEYIVAY